MLDLFRRGHLNLPLAGLAVRRDEVAARSLDFAEKALAYRLRGLVPAMPQHCESSTVSSTDGIIFNSSIE